MRNVTGEGWVMRLFTSRPILPVISGVRSLVKAKSWSPCDRAELWPWSQIFISKRAMITWGSRHGKINNKLTWPLHVLLRVNCSRCRNKELQILIYKTKTKCWSDSVGQAASPGERTVLMFRVRTPLPSFTKKGPGPKHHLSTFSRDAAWPAELLQHLVLLTVQVFAYKNLQ